MEGTLLVQQTGESGEQLAASGSDVTDALKKVVEEDLNDDKANEKLPTDEAKKAAKEALRKVEAEKEAEIKEGNTSTTENVGVAPPAPPPQQPQQQPPLVKKTYKLPLSVEEYADLRKELKLLEELPNPTQEQRERIDEIYEILADSNIAERAKAAYDGSWRGRLSNMLAALKGRSTDAYAYVTEVLSGQRAMGTLMSMSKDAFERVMSDPRTYITIMTSALLYFLSPFVNYSSALSALLMIGLSALIADTSIRMASYPGTVFLPTVQIENRALSQLRNITLQARAKGAVGSARAIVQGAKSLASIGQVKQLFVDTFAYMKEVGTFVIGSASFMFVLTGFKDFSLMFKALRVVSSTALQATSWLGTAVNHVVFLASMALSGFTADDKLVNVIESTIVDGMNSFATSSLNVPASGGGGGLVNTTTSALVQLRDSIAANFNLNFVYNTWVNALESVKNGNVLWALNEGGAYMREFFRNAQEQMIAQLNLLMTLDPMSVSYAQVSSAIASYLDLSVSWFSDKINGVVRMLALAKTMLQTLVTENYALFEQMVGAQTAMFLCSAIGMIVAGISVYGIGRSLFGRNVSIGDRLTQAEHEEVRMCEAESSLLTDWFLYASYCLSPDNENEQTRAERIGKLVGIYDEFVKNVREDGMSDLWSGVTSAIDVFANYARANIDDFQVKSRLHQAMHAVPALYEQVLVTLGAKYAQNESVLVRLAAMRTDILVTFTSMNTYIEQGHVFSESQTNGNNDRVGKAVEAAKRVESSQKRVSGRRPLRRR